MKTELFSSALILPARYRQGVPLCSHLIPDISEKVLLAWPSLLAGAHSEENDQDLEKSLIWMFYLQFHRKKK